MSDVLFRAGRSIRQSRGNQHPAAQIILHPRYNYKTLDVNVALVRGDDIVLRKPNFLTKPV